MTLTVSLDHGNMQMKGVRQIFTSGLSISDKPGLGGSYLYFDGKYYGLSEDRIPYMRDKTINDHFFVLTLFALAHEIDRNSYTQERHQSKWPAEVRLLGGLPALHYGVQKDGFKNYFINRSSAEFLLNDRQYHIRIIDMKVYPQGVAAMFTRIADLRLEDKLLMLDIGGDTTEIIVARKGKPDQGNFDSIEYGLIHLFTKIYSEVSRRFNILLEEEDLARVFMGKLKLNTEVLEVINFHASEFIERLYAMLRERKFEVRTFTLCFAGGGSILLRKYIEQIASTMNIKVTFIDRVTANAEGYELLYNYSQG